MKKETRLLLAVYPKNSIRLQRIAPALKVRGISKTLWINRAITEKLDRENPETDAASADYVPAKIKLDSIAAMEAVERLKREKTLIEESLKAFDLEEEKPELVKVEPVKAEPVKPEPVKPEPVKPELVKPELVQPELVKAEVDDFWGDEQFDMARAAKMLRHVRGR